MGCLMDTILSFHTWFIDASYFIALLLLDINFSSIFLPLSMSIYHKIDSSIAIPHCTFPSCKRRKERQNVPRWDYHTPSSIEEWRDRSQYTVLAARKQNNHIYIYIIKKDDGDITAAYVNESLKRGMESECSSDNITISLRREFRRTREERRGRVVERITTGRCNPLTRDFTRRLGERNN